MFVGKANDKVKILLWDRSGFVLYLKRLEKGRFLLSLIEYGASFLAHIAVANCADHRPIYRLEKELARLGDPVARSTMNELLHRASALLAPVWTRLLDVIRARDIVLADETRLRILKDASGKPKTAPVAEQALDLITELYRVEHDAKERRLCETAHVELRHSPRGRFESDSRPGSTRNERDTRRRARSAPRSDTRSASGSSSASSSMTRACRSTRTHQSARFAGSRLRQPHPAQ